MPPQRLARAFHSLRLAVLLPLAACDAGEACESSLHDEQAFTLCMNEYEGEDFTLAGEAPGPEHDEDDLRCKPSDIAISTTKSDPGSLPISCGPPTHPAEP
jgi:hypothetical protein